MFKVRNCVKAVRVFDYKHGFGFWIGRYAFFKIEGYLLPVIIPRYDFQRLGITDRETGAVITDRDAYTAREYLEKHS